MLLNRTIKRSIFTVISQSEVAYREFLGANRVRLLPGLRLKLPIFHELQRVSLKEQIVQLSNQDAYTKDNVPVSVSGTVFYKIFDAQKVIYQIKNQKLAIKSIGESSFRAVIGRFQYDEIIANRNTINHEMMQILGTTTNDWGIKTTRLQIQNFGPQNSVIAQQLQKQMQAQRTRRENELQTQADIRTAQGAKQIAILNSEGHLISAKNRSEAMRYEMNATSNALSEQIQCLAKKNFNGDVQKAANYLLEMKRMENLQQIAQSTNKQIYFIPPDGLLPKTKIIGDLLGRDQQTKK